MLARCWFRRDHPTMRQSRRPRWCPGGHAGPWNELAASGAEVDSRRAPQLGVPIQMLRRDARAGGVPAPGHQRTAEAVGGERLGSSAEATAVNRHVRPLRTSCMGDLLDVECARRVGRSNRPARRHVSAAILGLGLIVETMSSRVSPGDGARGVDPAHEAGVGAGFTVPCDDLAALAVGDRGREAVVSRVRACARQRDQHPIGGPARRSGHRQTLGVNIRRAGAPVGPRDDDTIRGRQGEVLLPLGS